jgi:hypothetical protein
MSVGALAAHLAGQVLFVRAALDETPPQGEPIDIMGHYERVTWIGADVDSDVNVAIRGSAERNSADGADAVAGKAAAAVLALRSRLAAEPEGRTVSPPAGPWALTLDDFLVTRMMEITVHSDDLACSVGLPTPTLPDAVTKPVFALLTDLAVLRHGPTAVLRAFSRAERAPNSIAAF